jgi:hypothetical protein
MAKGFNIKEDKRYRLEEEQTTGWYSLADNVSQQECKQLYDERLNEGVNPQRLRITRIA